MRTTMGIDSHVMPTLAREAADRTSALLPGVVRPTAPQLQPQTSQAVLRMENGLLDGVELRGLQPLTPTLPGRLVGVHVGSWQCVSAAQRAEWSSRNGSERPCTT